MPPSVRTLRYTQRELDLGGGLNLVDPPTEIADNQLVKCDNLWYPGGVLSKRPGFFKLNSSAISMGGGNLLRVIGYNQLNGKYLLGALAGTTLTEITNAGAVNTVTGTITQQAGWIQYVAGTMYIGFNSTMAVRTLSGGAISGAPIANSPASNMAAFHKNILFTDIVGTPGRLFFSDFLDPTVGSLTWTTTNFINIAPDNNESITALIPLGDLLLIFTNTSVYSLYVLGVQSSWVLRKISDYGCAPAPGNGAAVYHDGAVYFISKSGVFKTNGSSFVEISKNVWNPLNPLYSVITAVGIDNWRIVRFFDHLFLVFNDASPTNGYTYAYNFETGAWSSWNFLGSTRGFDDVFVNYQNQYPEVIVTLGQNAYLANSNTAFSYDTILAAGYNSYADGFLINSLGTGSAYTSQFTTKEMTSFVDWYWRIKWMSLEYTCRTPGPTFNMIGDGSARATIVPGFHATQRKAYKIPGAGRVRQFQLNCSHALTSPFEFYRGELHFALKTHISASGAP